MVVSIGASVVVSPSVDCVEAMEASTRPDKVVAN